jgi:tyrosine-protein kinase Etk/Wzc
MSPKNEGARVVELDASGEGAHALSPTRRSGFSGAGEFGDNEPTLSEYIGTILESRVLVVAITASAVVLAALYLFFAAPNFRSDVLLQVEDKSKGIAGLDDLSNVFSEKAPADTEMEILRSRSLLGSVVDDLSLTIETSPRLLPVFGGGIYRRHDQDDIARPLLGLSSLAWGGERIQVTRLQVPDGLLDHKLRLTAEGTRYTLNDPDGQVLVSGEVGKPAAAGEGDDRVEIFVAELHARPGTQFNVTKRRRAGVVDHLQNDLHIGEKGKKTGILTVAMDGKDPKKISGILDAVAQTYVRQNVERKSAEAAKQLEFLQEQLPVVKKDVDTTEAAFKSYQLKKGSVDLSAETQAMLDRAVDIEKSLSELELNRAELKQRFTSNHPILLSLKEKQDKLRAEKAAIESKMRGLPEQELESVRLTRDAKVASELYFLILNKAQELKVVKSGTIGNVRILDTALKPYEPVSPKKGPVLALSLLLGLAGGIGAAFARKAMHQGVEDPAEIEAGAGVSVYASVPYSNREADLMRQRSHGGKAASLLAAADPGDLAIESLRSLRTALQFALVDSPNNVVTISSPSPGVGKTFLSANLAHVLATSGKRVLLVDGDLRRGRVHRYFGGDRTLGVSEVVSGQALFADAVRRTGEANLDYITTGKLPPNPSELVGSPRFKAFLNDVSGRYDLVLVDTPPILAVTDGAVLGKYAGVNLVALRAGRHPMREIVMALKHFSDSGVHIHGTVLNGVSLSGGRFSRAYQYHYHYAYRSDPDDDA